MRLFSNKRLILVLLGLIWFELSFLPLFSIEQMKPDLFFIFLVFYAFQINWKRVVTLAFLIGFIQDLVTNWFFGLQTASYVAGAVLLQFFAIRFDRDKRWIQLTSLCAFSWVSLLLFSFLAFLIQPRYHLGEWVLVKTFLISIYTTVIGAILFPLFEKWLKPALRDKQYELF